MTCVTSLCSGADGTFNLLEYADPELDDTLAEEHDKSIFDEHLGLSSDQNAGSNNKSTTENNAAPPQSPQQQQHQHHQQQQQMQLQQLRHQQQQQQQSPVSLPQQKKGSPPQPANDRAATEKTDFKVPVSSAPNTKNMSPKSKPSPSSEANTSSPDAGKPKPADFQSQFLEFSRRRSTTIEDEDDKGKKTAEKKASESSIKVEVKDEKMEQTDGCGDERADTEAEMMQQETSSDEEVADYRYCFSRSVDDDDDTEAGCEDDILCVDGATDDKSPTAKENQEETTNNTVATETGDPATITATTSADAQQTASDTDKSKSVADPPQGGSAVLESAMPTADNNATSAVPTQIPPAQTAVTEDNNAITTNTAADVQPSAAETTVRMNVSQTEGPSAPSDKRLWNRSQSAVQEAP